MLVNISQPFDYVLKTFLIRYVVDEHYAHRSTVITCGDCVKAFLTGGLKRIKQKKRMKKIVEKKSNFEKSEQSHLKSLGFQDKNTYIPYLQFQNDQKLSRNENNTEKKNH